MGAHSWQAMAFNPKTGLFYIPAQEVPLIYASGKDFKPAPIGWNIGTGTTNPRNVRGYLLAWDPVNQKEVWRANYMGPCGGILTTAGNLVIQGNAVGFLSAYRADTGEKLWSMSAQSAIVAAPVTYEVDGEQYVAVLSGWGGAYPLMQGRDSDKSGNTRNVSRVLVFKLGANGSLPPLPPEAALPLDSPPATADAATIKTGEALFARFCSVCHGEAAIGGGVVPDLRTSPFIAVDAWYSIVLDGALKEGGMAPFAPVLDREQATAIRDYIIHRANEDKPVPGSAEQHKPDPNHGQPLWPKARRPAPRLVRNATPSPVARTAVARSPPRRSVGILSPEAVARLQFGRARKRHHVADRARALAGRYRRRSRLLRKRRNAVPDARGSRFGSRQEGAGARRGGPWREGSSRLQRVSRRRGRRPGADSPIPRRAICAYTAFQLKMWQQGLPQEQSRGDGAFRQEARRSRNRGACRLFPAGSLVRLAGDAGEAVNRCSPESLTPLAPCARSTFHGGGRRLLPAGISRHRDIEIGGSMSTDPSGPHASANGTTEHHISAAATREHVAAPIDASERCAMGHAARS